MNSCLINGQVNEETVRTERPNLPNPTHLTESPASNGTMAFNGVIKSNFSPVISIQY